MRSGFAAIRRALAEDPMKVIGPLVIVLVTFLVAWLLRRLVLRSLNAWTNRTGRRGGLLLTQALRGPTLIWCAILAVHLGMQSSALPARFTDMESATLLVLWVCSLTLMSMRLAADMVRLYAEQIPGALPVTTLTQTLAQIAVVILGAS